MWSTATLFNLIFFFTVFQQLYIMKKMGSDMQQRSRTGRKQGMLQFMVGPLNPKVKGVKPQKYFEINGYIIQYYTYMALESDWYWSFEADSDVDIWKFR